MHSRKAALTQARIYRTCPHLHIMNNPAHEFNVQRHISICPYCGTQEIEDKELWQDLSSQIQKHIQSKLPHLPGYIPEAGQLRYICSDAGRWQGPYFFNPPMVLLTDEKNIMGDIPAAQVYHDIYLAGPGDLILSYEQTGLDNLFVECQNTYQVSFENLGPVAGRVSSQIIKYVKQMKISPETYPPQALRPRPISHEDPRLYFLELENSVSSVFSSAYGKDSEFYPHSLEIEGINSDCNDTPLSFHDKTASYQVESVADIFKKNFQPVFWGLSHTEDAGHIRSALVFIKDSRLKTVQPLKTEIFQIKKSSEKIQISGRVTGISLTCLRSISSCFFWLENREMIWPDKLDFNGNTGVFQAEFNTEKDMKQYIRERGNLLVFYSQ